jgi:hypothetical protein
MQMEKDRRGKFYSHKIPVADRGIQMQAVQRNGKERR